MFARLLNMFGETKTSGKNIKAKIYKAIVLAIFFVKANHVSYTNATYVF